MLDALVRHGALSKHASVREASGKAQVRLKSSEKCAFIVNCVKRNACDSRKPRGFQLPQIEQLRDSILVGGRQKLYMAKLDLSNCFWSVRLPRRWVGEFSVCVWEMPSMFGSSCRLGGSTHHSCVRSWFTAWSGPQSGGYLCCFLST